MKKVFTLVAVAAMFTFVACGPSAEEKAAAEKKIADSTANYVAAEAAKVQAIADSTAAYATAEAAKAQATADSLAAALEAAKSKGKTAPKAKTIQEKTKEEAKKATGGRG
ncbi:MAG: hypothetical protein A3F72_10465 [Bacteroidetes bacterium RIFCSPLOWO2_12_FULL_35_15]|nr:MAG: hypothetical protein A3F72_10465 [Bacteroidetes bacterium RIFCSPLOWO2_12_FULL_35_15]